MCSTETNEIYLLCYMRDHCMHCLTLQNQETALMRAARKGNVGIVKMLLQHGVNVNLTNKVTGPCA